MSDLEISTQQLQQWLEEGHPSLILDVRPLREREEWSIPDSIHMDIYERLKSGDTSALDDLTFPKDGKIVVVCAAGKTSRIAAEILQGKGASVYSLSGGMKAWNYAWNKAEYFTPESGTKVVQVRRSVKGCLSYIVGSESEAVVVDASLDPEVYLQIAKENSWTIRYVMDTHIHADYLSRTRELASKSNASHLFIDKADVDFPFTPIIDGQEIAVGKSKIRVIHSPGHTFESTSYLIDSRALLAGDTLFTDGVGRPDLKADKAQAIQKSAQLFESLRKLTNLPGEIEVLPAHISHAVPFDKKLIGANLSALKSKLELLNMSKEDFINATLLRIPPAPPNYMTIAALNKKGSYDGYLPENLEAGANRCAVS